jgi:2-polyprenyl-3-methyl-5-hydroxy-6-metoxy-1,4-benzoquinol methylase
MTLQEKIAKLAQFPHKERTQPYQSYWMKDVGYVNGTRQTLYRFDLMGLPALFTGASVLDLGSQVGAMSIEATRRGASRVLGLEYEKDFVECAQELAKYNQMDISYKQMDLKNLSATVDIIHDFFGKNNTVDVVFALSLTKHIGTIALYQILRNFRWKYCFVEGHNCNGNLTTPHCQDIQNNLISKFSNTFLGFSEDRSIRPVWRLDQVPKRG